MSKRETWVDIVKGIAIIAVVMFHTNYNITKLVVGGGNILPLTELLGTLWHVPVFLCIGEFFLKETDLDNPLVLVKKKWKSLYVKLLVFYVIFILLHNWFFTIGSIVQRLFMWVNILHLIVISWIMLELVVLGCLLHVNLYWERCGLST